MNTVVTWRATRTGVVDEFDDARGLGHVLGDDGRRYGFHCTAVADGSRHIEAGTRVTFTVTAAHLGRTEARFLVPCETSPPVDSTAGGNPVVQAGA